MSAFCVPRTPCCSAGCRQRLREEDGDFELLWTCVKTCFFYVNVHGGMWCVCTWCALTHEFVGPMFWQSHGQPWSCSPRRSLSIGRATGVQDLDDHPRFRSMYVLLLSHSDKERCLCTRRKFAATPLSVRSMNSTIRSHDAAVSFVPLPYHGPDGFDRDHVRVPGPCFVFCVPIVVVFARFLHFLVCLRFAFRPIFSLGPVVLVVVVDVATSCR